MLTADEVRHVAMLARLGLTDEEVEKLRVQLLDVLGYIDMLKKVDTSTMPPPAQILTPNVMRPDEPRHSWPVEDILSNAPAREDDFLRVPPVLEDARGEDEVEGEESVG